MANEAQALVSDEGQPLPPGPHEDGTIGVLYDSTEVYFWDANANQWKRARRPK